MEQNSTRTTSKPTNPVDSSPRRGLNLGLAVGLIVLLGAAFGYRLLRQSAPPPETAVATEPASAAPAPKEEDDLSAAVVKAPPADSGPRERTSAVPIRPVTGPRPATSAPASTKAPTPAPLPATALYSSQVIQRMLQTDPNQAKISPEQAQALKQNFKDLVGQGAAAVPAIRQFLEQNQDFNFEEGFGTSGVGYSSLRAGLFDTLKQIGGPEAIDTLASTMRSTGDPAELALVTKYLEDQAPGVYRQEAVSAARDTLEQLARGQVQIKDTGPLFQVLQSYGDASVVADLQKNMPQYQYYAAMALAGLPEGQGVSSLIQSVQESVANGHNPNSFELQMLAQTASQNPDAAAALVEQAKQGQIPDRAWTKIVEGLAGDQYQVGKPPLNPNDPSMPPVGLKTYHIEAGNQNFYSLPFNITGTADQFSQRRAVIDQLIAATQNPAALQALQNARAVLAAPPP